MARDRDVQKLWHAELAQLGFKKVGRDAQYFFDEEWSGFVGLTTSSNYGTGSSVDVTIGVVWHPFTELAREVAPFLVEHKGEPVFGEALFEIDPLRSERLGPEWKIQEGPYGPIDLSAPVTCLVEQGVPKSRKMCSVEYALDVLRWRGFNPNIGGALWWASYVLALEVVGLREDALGWLGEFEVRHAAKKLKYQDPDFVDFVVAFRERCGA
ncbi:hypothetical protein ACN082_04065 [Rothia sp. CCM 9417]|uniref:hypothetical protein n=1 Tax=Rothia sp. CCM 9417 TaxID=3402657 RepID=UPI003ADC278D